MDKNIAIEFQGVGKQYRLGRVGTGTLQHDLNRFWQTTILGKEDPYLKIGEVNDRSEKAHSDYVWALKDINFKVEQGDVVGIIGKNGAGKSTLLKLLSHITSPTTGDIYYRGRIASLLEVGTGFHGELTGKENIFMNGAVLGMTKHEIRRKLDDIIEFAGVEKYIDTPVKRYSSGMTVRLGFAVAAFLEPEILVVDEVLTVGDAEFQKRAIGKMDDVAKNGGRTVLFVSHNMTAVKSLCNNAVLLENGTIKDNGNVDYVVTKYLANGNTILNHKIWTDPEIKKDGYELLEIGVKKRDGTYEEPITVEDSIEIIVKYKLNRHFNKFYTVFHFKNEQGEKFLCSSAYDKIPTEHHAGIYELHCFIPANFLNWGNVTIDLFAMDNSKILEESSDIISFAIVSGLVESGRWMGRVCGDILSNLNYQENRL